MTSKSAGPAEAYWDSKFTAGRYLDLALEPFRKAIVRVSARTGGER